MRGKYNSPTVLRLKEKVTGDSGLIAFETSLDLYLYMKSVIMFVIKVKKKEIHNDFYPVDEQNVIELMDVKNNAEPLSEQAFQNNACINVKPEGGIPGICVGHLTSIAFPISGI